MKRRKENSEDEGVDEDEGPTLKRSRGNGSDTALNGGGGKDVQVEASALTKRSSQRGSIVSEKPETNVVSQGINEASNNNEIGDSGEGESQAKAEAEPAVATPKRGRPRKILDSMQVNGITPTKIPNGRRHFSTPSKVINFTDISTPNNETPTLKRNVNRSARKKATRSLIERITRGSVSDCDEDEEDIAQNIYDEDEDEEIGIDTLGVPETPSKRKGRQKGMKTRAKSPSPSLHDLPPHEKYFFQNRPGRVKTSDNNLSSLLLLDHEEYFYLIRKFKDPNTPSRKVLQELHAKSFNQWQFELSQNFNICIYGYGSKRSLLMRFTDHIYKHSADRENRKIVVVNGYVHNLTIRDVLNTVASALSGPGQKIGSQPAEMLQHVITMLEEDNSQQITVIIHSIDRLPLRRPATQAILSRFASHSQVNLIASADHPNFPLLWDSSLRSTYNFLFHNCTTFEPYSAEVDVVDEVNELLGRSGRRVGGKEGVSFVLKSLPENAKNLFRVLISEQLVAMDENVGSTAEEEEDGDEKRPNHTRKSEIGVEYRVLYQKACEEFICSNEMAFRTLLKEFHDHQMVTSRKDVLGAEMLSVPFRKEELETILEDIMS
ncbi:origin recognition complex subunit 2-domain-containing protein [Tricladium varicosporioides]|nr:origin recognition complex subunit 2-domain-containing protein [Hymenoscyphus varicosporioides]